jgi:drug/metabolite transporter (DMT)-like permease
MAAHDARHSGAYLPLALMGIAVVIFGTGYWPTAVAAEHGPPIMVTAVRVATSALLVLVTVLVFRRRLPVGSVLGWAALAGVLSGVVFQVGLTESIARAGAGNGAVVINTSPLMVLALAWLLLRERLSPIGIFGLLLGFGGVVLMVATQLGGPIETSQLLTGCALGLMAALAFSFVALIVRRISGRPGGVDMVGFIAVQFAVATTVLVPIAFALEGTATTDWGSDAFWASMVWTGPGAALAALLLYLTLERVPAAKTTSALFLVPAVAIVVEIARGNAPDALALSGMVVAVAGVALATLPRERTDAILARLGRDRAASPPSPG